MPAWSAGVQSGIRSAQPTPASDAAGVLYFVEDEDILERWSGSAWVAVATNGAAGGLKGFDSASYTSGGIILNWTSFAQLGPADLTVPADEGDILAVSIQASHSTEAQHVDHDVATMVSASPVNYISGGRLTGVQAWWARGDGGGSGAGGAVYYPVVAGDIDSGNVTLRWMSRVEAGSRTIHGDAARGPDWQVVNLGGVP